MTTHASLILPDQRIKYEAMAKELADYITDPHSAMLRLIDGFHYSFVLCGSSGSGKTLSIDFANDLLDEHNQIADVNELVMSKDYEAVEATILSKNYYVPDYRYICYTICDHDMGMRLSRNKDIKVFFMAE